MYADLSQPVPATLKQEKYMKFHEFIEAKFKWLLAFILQTNCGRYYVSSPYRFILSETAAIMTLIQFIRAINVHIECQKRITLSQCCVNESGRCIFLVLFILETGKGVGRLPNRAVVHTRPNTDKLYGTQGSAAHISLTRGHIGTTQRQTTIEPVMQIRVFTI